MIVTKLPDFAQWVVTVTPTDPASKKTAGSASASSPSVAQTLVFTKTNPVLHVQTMNDAVLVEDRWILGGAQVTADVPSVAGKPRRGENRRNHRDTQVVTAPSLRFPFVSHPVGPTGGDVSYDKTDFPDLAWISAAKFDRTMQDKTTGRKVLIFKDILLTTFDDGTVEKTGVVAEVDFETRLPVYRRDASVTRTYQIKGPPSVMQVVPQMVQEVIDEEAKNNAINDRPAGSP